MRRNVRAYELNASERTADLRLCRGSRGPTKKAAVAAFGCEPTAGVASSRPNQTGGRGATEADSVSVRFGALQPNCIVEFWSLTLRIYE